jgi:tetratricopeptide (TPR) repeat protein
MKDPTIQLVTASVVRIIARPFTHDELMTALQEISHDHPASPMPHLAMAIAFGLGHRDLAALKQHVTDAQNRLARIRPLRGDAETAYMQALCSALHTEALLVELQRERRRGVPPTPSQQRQWAQTAAAGEVALSRMDELLPELGDSLAFQVLSPAMHALALATDRDSPPYAAAVAKLSQHFWRKQGLGELAGLFLLYTHYKRDDLKEAAHVGEEMARRNPQSLLALTTLGNTYYFSDRLAEAGTCYRHATELAPQNPRTHLGYAKIAERLGQHDEARHALQVARSLDGSQHLAPAMDRLDLAIGMALRLDLKPVERRQPWGGARPGEGAEPQLSTK